MVELGREFAATIVDLDLPDDDLVARVLNDLEPSSARATSRLSGRSLSWWDGGRGPRLGLALAGSALVVLLAALAIEPARTAVADIFGFGATRIERDSQPTPTTQPDLGTPATSAGTATENSQDEINPSSGVANPIPSLGQPLVEDGDTAGRRRYVWPPSESLPPLAEPEVGLVLEVRQVTGAFDTKQLGAAAGTEFMEIEVESGETLAMWIPDFHQRIVVEGFPAERPEASNAAEAGPTLIWTVGELQFRLEADIELNRAVALAGEVTGGTELLAPG